MTPKRFLDLVRRNPVIDVLIERLPSLGLPDCWIVSMSLVQTVWNLEDGRDPTEGIKDYDIFYFDGGDLSYEAEDQEIVRLSALFADVDAEIELRNQARVHLWFDERNGTDSYTALRSSREGIDRFLSRMNVVGIAPRAGAPPLVYAPYGYADMEGRLMRPNPKAIGPARHYREKAARYRARYPDLRVETWNRDRDLDRGAG